MTILSELADRYANVDHADIPSEVRRAARHCILDWTGCAIAGQQEQLADILRAELVGRGEGPSRLVGRSDRVGMLDAALINGAAGHALDFDDTNLEMAGHPTAPVLPALLALADVVGAAGRDIVTALVVGTEIEVRLAKVLGRAHYDRGWHTTSTVGVVGAAAACSRLLDQPATAMTTAIALAVTQAGGLKASFGTMAKPLHAGRAAANGLLAARLAARGFTANPAIVEAVQGLGVATLPEGAALRAVDDVDGHWFTADTHFKFHAACYGTHAAINSALRLRRELAESGISTDEIDRVTVRVTPSLLNVCGIEHPTTGLEGKFSLRATTALTLLGESTADLSQYTDERMRASDLVSMLERITVVGDTAQEDAITTIEVITSCGRSFEASHDARTRSDDPEQEWAALVEKFHALTDSILGRGGADQIVAAVAALDDRADHSFAWPVCGGTHPTA